MGRFSLLVTVALLWQPVAGGQSLSPVETEIVRHIDGHVDEAVEFLERVVNINSGTMNPTGVRQVARVFAPALEELGFSTRWIALPPEVHRSGHLFAHRRGSRGKRLLLIGHLDTVFEKDSPFQRFERQGRLARGPGVQDMKGGDVVLLYALKALHSAGALEGTTMTVALIGDEESPGTPIEITRGDLLEAARHSDAALGFEAGVGTLLHATVARRGSSRWTLKVEGRSGHSSQVFSQRYGSGAIFEAARILHSFHQELRGEEYLTFNPGVILGGTEVEFDSGQARGRAFGKTNVIAQTVVVEGGLRFLSTEQKEQARRKMRQIVAQHLPGTSAEITFGDAYPAMSPTAGNYALFEVFDGVCRDLGLGGAEVVDPGRRGAADISFVAPLVDSLGGLGVMGTGGHSPDETVELDSLPMVIKRAALLIHRLSRGEPPQP